MAPKIKSKYIMGIDRSNSHSSVCVFAMRKQIVAWTQYSNASYSEKEFRKKVKELAKFYKIREEDILYERD